MQFFFDWFLVFARAGAMLSVFPVFSAGAVPVRLRIALGALLAFLVSPTLVGGPNPAQLGLLDAVLLLFKEISIGLLMGYICRLLFFSVQLAGHFISMETGLQMAQLVAPGESTPTEVPAAMLNLLAVMLLLALDIHQAILIGFTQSYAVLPIDGGRLTEELFRSVTALAARTFLVAVKIAAPLIAVSIVVNLLLMVFARATPQMNIFAESFSVRILVGLALFGLTMNLTAEHIAAYLRQLPEDFILITRLLGG